MEIIDYKAPQAKVFEVNAQGLLCGSVTGGFGLSNGGKVEKGDDSDWGEDLNW